jgi:hypothetical protein
MTDLICRKSMMRCQTPGMCAPHGGCQPERGFESQHLDLGKFIDWVYAVKTERDQLKAENEALRAEAAKWKNESVSDSQTIYSLSCNLAQRTGEVRELAGVVDDLAALTKKFVQRLSKAAPDNDLPAKAMDYLGRKGLQGSAMREIVEGRLS